MSRYLGSTLVDELPHQGFPLAPPEQLFRRGVLVAKLGVVETASAPRRRRALRTWSRAWLAAIVTRYGAGSAACLDPSLRVQPPQQRVLRDVLGIARRDPEAPRQAPEELEAAEGPRWLAHAGSTSERPSRGQKSERSGSFWSDNVPPTRHLRARTALGAQER